jgi:hypothetical protein
MACQRAPRGVFIAVSSGRSKHAVNFPVDERLSLFERTQQHGGEVSDRICDS